jgi:hypothetical protein
MGCAARTHAASILGLRENGRGAGSVCQFEQLWGDLTALAEVACGFVAVPRPRDQQLKDPAQLDGWLRDGSAASVEALCAWE